ncbi:hypothetical protein [Nonomuraea turcica]|uniref:hypothetical protein n=1 Tax=Nonomuraea sp. G32 TaxID=3067274 RepID=UPI00273BD4F9|nr:hypothetical protein [Nonomuraea sp. G32]MDP4510338.1 hypothetical protein [Nonomuraea sp. G32]
MADELYRFIQLRGAVPAEPGGGLLINAWSEPPSEFQNRVVEAEDPATVAREWLAEAGDEELLVSLRRLDTAITGSVGVMTVARFQRLVVRYLDSAEVLENARARAQDALMASLLVPETSSAVRNAVHRMVILAVAGQRVLRWAGDRDGGDGEALDQALRDLLDRGAAVLPGQVSQLLIPRLEEEPQPMPQALDFPVAEREIGPVLRDLEPEPVPPDRENGSRRRAAALAELVALAADPEIESEVRPAPQEEPPDEASPKLRPLREMAVRPPRAMLRGAVLERISEETRAVLDELAPGEADLLNAVNTLERARLWAPLPLAAKAAEAIDPTGGFPLGYGALRPPVAGLVRPPGIGELLVVRREHTAYVPGPITYIENVMAGETRERTHRRQDRTEDTTFTETENTVVDERDLQSTERFDLVAETSREISAQTQLQAGAQVSGSYGTVQASASFGFTSSSASTEAARTSTTTARETVDRALKRITERTLERRQRITIREIEETNRHELTNPGNVPNRAGIYRFVDDEQDVGVYAYGLRLMVEAHVPEPGVFLRWITTEPADGSDPEPPPPSLPSGARLSDPGQLDPSNYLAVAGPQGAVVEPPPLLFQTVAMAGKQEYTQNTPDAATAAFLFYRSEERLQVPDGYTAVRAAGVLYASAWKFDCYLSVGAANFRDTSGDGAMPLTFDLQLAGETGMVPVAFTIHNAWGYAYTLEIVCQRTQRSLERWQVQTFTAIMQAYADRHAAWEERGRAADIVSSGVITGTNPALNRRRERSELKKMVIGLLSGSPLDRFGAIRQGAAADEPVMDAPAAVGQSAVVSFYEQAFEWENMIYSLYPYFWGRRSSWQNAFTLDGVDPDHDAFLKAGLARTVVPVRPGFEQVALWFLATGQVWSGGSPPPISGSDPLYVSIASEILAADRADQGGVLQGETWPVRTPTNLVYLQRDSNLNPPPV